mmetsp:Transcript_24745/g.68915  ORF Transcript_24745/g.68915 Transcript_24745/m.68915 type:complete len:256 (-) Transcript_24745:1584-2351(-)
MAPGLAGLPGRKVARPLGWLPCVPKRVAEEDNVGTAVARPNGRRQRSGVRVGGNPTELRAVRLHLEDGHGGDPGEFGADGLGERREERVGKEALHVALEGVAGVRGGERGREVGGEGGRHGKGEVQDGRTSGAIPVADPALVEGATVAAQPRRVQRGGAAAAGDIDGECGAVALSAGVEDARLAARAGSVDARSRLATDASGGVYRPGAALPVGVDDAAGAGGRHLAVGAAIVGLAGTRRAAAGGLHCAEPGARA